MTQIPKLSALFETSLASALSAAGSSFSVVSGTDRDGNALSGLYGFIIDEGTASEEFVVGTISGTTVTISKRGCDADSPETEVSANKKAHRRGVSVKITDYPILAYLRHALAGETGYELPALLKYAPSVGDPTDDKHVASRAWVLTVVNGGTVSHDRVTVSGNAGETVAAGNLVYFDDTDNEWKKCDADTAATVENVILGIAQGAGVDGGAIANGVLLMGVDANQSGLTVGIIYYASNTAGGISSSAGTKEVSIGFSKTTTELYVYPRFNQQLTEDLQDALTPGGDYGTPSSSNPFLTKDSMNSTTLFKAPTTQTFTAGAATTMGDTTSQFDITNPSGTTFRYTWDATGTDPGITAVTLPTGTPIVIESETMNAANTGYFVITGSGTNFFEVSNASGVVESNKTLQDGYLRKISSQTYTKPSGVKYVVIEVQGAGAAGNGVTTNNNSGGRGGGAGAYSRKLIAAASLGSTETLYVGVGGLSVADNSSGKFAAFASIFGAHLTAPGASGQTGATASGGDFNRNGGDGGPQFATISGRGGDSQLGTGARSIVSDGVGVAGTGYGAGGSGAFGDSSSSAAAGGAGAPGIIIVTEHYF